MLNNTLFFIFGLIVGLAIFYPATGLFKDEQLIIAIATIILAFITGYYAFITNKILESQKEQTSYQNRPEINISTNFFHKGSGVYSFAIVENVGKSTAYDICFNVQEPECKFTEKKALKDLLFVRENIKSLNPGEHRQFHIDEKPKITHKDEIKFLISYKDMTGKNYAKENFIYLTGLSNKLHPLSNIAPAINGVSAGIGSIATVLSSINNSLNKKDY